MNKRQAAATDRVRARLRGERRPRSRLAIWGLACLGLIGLLAVNLIFKAAPQSPAEHLSLEGLRVAYGRVTPGQTEMRALAGLGFDVTQPAVKRVSYLALMEAFMPGTSKVFDDLDPAARKCLAAAAGCSAYVFRLARVPGNAEQASFSLIDAAQAAPSAEILFLIHDGRVAYKAMSGL